MRYVEVFKYDGPKIVTTGEFAIFHQFGVNYDEFESGPGPFTTAVIEMPDGTVKNIKVELIKFTDT